MGGLSKPVHIVHTVHIVHWILKHVPLNRTLKCLISAWENIVLAGGEENTKKEIFTVQIKNIVELFMSRWENEPMSKMQNGPAQRHSRMSILKIETENSLPQRHSKMSNGRLAGYYAGRMGRMECLL